VHRVSDVGQIGVRTAEPLVPGPSPFEGEIAVARIQTRGEPLWSEIHKISNSGIRISRSVEGVYYCTSLKKRG
jgi:hypothetical protein